MVIALVVVAALLLVVDRGGAYLAGRLAAARLQDSAGLATRPDVSVTGFPFLTQLLRGRYQRIEVVASGVPAGTARLRTLSATLRDVRLPLSSLLSGNVASVPVGQLDARALLAYDELTRRSGSRELTFAPAGNEVRVTGSVRVLGRTLSAAALSTVALDGGSVSVVGRSFRTGNGVADAVLTAGLRDKLDLRVDVSRLPYGLAVRSVAVEPNGIAILAGARDAVLLR